MSQRRKTDPPTRESSRSARAGRSGLIAKEKTEKQSAKRRTVLDNRFHRTALSLSCTAKARVPKSRGRQVAAYTAGQRHTICNLHDADVSYRSFREVEAASPGDSPPVFQQLREL